MDTAMSLYSEPQMVVRIDEGDSMSFEVKVTVHQGSVKSSLVFVIVMDQVTKESREGLATMGTTVLYADDLVLMSPTNRDD